jgi:UDP:flavonoid glycosyltransferase YjiC (YdhE family)
MMSKRTVAFFAMTEKGHFQRLHPVIAGLTGLGLEAHVFTDRRFEPDVRRAGGEFVDLFGKYPLAGVDTESVPVPCRFVTFAARYADEIAAHVESLRASLVIYDTFAVIGRVVARMLGLPYVNVCAGHNMDPARFVPMLEVDPRVALSESCKEAVATLGDRYGIEDASPFSYVSGVSPYLNVYCEPPAYLAEAERRPFEPIAFFGSLPPPEEIEHRRRGQDGSVFANGQPGLKAYVSFGTVVWRYWADEALDALRTISESFAELPETRALIGLGGAEVARVAEGVLARPNVAVEHYVDQWRVLREADVFVTHQGLNSTHEAIFSGVPMISYPFFSDQPALAERCRRLGLAIPLTERPRAPVTKEAFLAALQELSLRRDSLMTRLAEARTWELDVIAGRESVLRRIAALAEA